MTDIPLPASDSLDKALKAAAPGDTINIVPGSYPKQNLTYDLSMEGAPQPITVLAAGATVAGFEMSGVQHVVFDGFVIEGLMNVRPSTGNSWTAQSKTSHDLTFTNVDGKTFLLRNVEDILISECKWGGWDASVTPLGPPKIGAYIAAAGVAQRNSRRVLIEDCLFHDMLRTLTGTAHAEGFYFDAGVEDCTIRGCVFTNCGVFDIFSNGVSGDRTINNILIENNLLDAPRDQTGGVAASAINFKGGSGKVTLRGNSILGNIRLDASSVGYDWVSERNAIGQINVASRPTIVGSTDVVLPMAEIGFVSASNTPCDLNACYRNDLHVKADSPAGEAGAGVPADGNPPPPPSPPPAPTVDELIDKAAAAFKATTVSYPTWTANVAAGKYTDVKTTKWWQGFDYLEQAKAKT